MAVNWVTKVLRRLAQRKELQWWEAKIGGRGYSSSCLAYCEIPYELGCTKKPTAFHGPLGLKYYPVEKANMTDLIVWKTSSRIMMCDRNYEQWVEARGKLCSVL
jgi:hypothetical protein